MTEAIANQPHIRRLDIIGVSLIGHVIAEFGHDAYTGTAADRAYVHTENDIPVIINGIDYDIRSMVWTRADKRWGRDNEPLPPAFDWPHDVYIRRATGNSGNSTITDNAREKLSIAIRDALNKLVEDEPNVLKFGRIASLRQQAETKRNEARNMFQKGATLQEAAAELDMIAKAIEYELHTLTVR